MIPDPKEVWEVECVVDSRIVNGVQQYLVKWKDTWLDNQLLEVWQPLCLCLRSQKIDAGGCPSLLQAESYRSMIESTVAPTAGSKAKQARKGNGKQSLVRLKNSWEPASNLSASCIELWEAAKAKEEQQKTTVAKSARTTKKQQSDKPKRPRGRPPKRRKQEEQAEKEAKEAASEMVVEIPIVKLEEEVKQAATEPTTTETPRPTVKRKREEEEDEAEKEKDEERKADEHADPRQEAGGGDEPLMTTDLDRQDGPSSSSAAPEEQKATPDAETACENAPATDQHVSSEESTVPSPAAPSWLPQEVHSTLHMLVRPRSSFVLTLPPVSCAACIGSAHLLSRSSVRWPSFSRGASPAAQGSCFILKLYCFQAPSSAAPVPSRSSRSKSAEGPT